LPPALGYGFPRYAPFSGCHPYYGVRRRKDCGLSGPEVQSRRRFSSYFPVWSLSDESLLAGLASGDPDAAAAFVRRFQARVFGLAVTILGDPGAAEDVAQETFVRAWQHAESYDARRGRVSTWLLSIARNLAIDTLRLKRYLPTERDLGAAMTRSVEDATEERAFAGDDLRRVRRALGALPEEQRRALLLATFFGRTAREIAALEGMPLGTAKTRVRTALLRLRSELEVVDER